MDSRSRSARYTGLRPRKYRFRVQASTDGKTLEQPGSLDWNLDRPALVDDALEPGRSGPRHGGPAFRRLQAEGQVAARTRSAAAELVDQRTAELVEANKRAEQARSQAEQANRAKSVFLANMSHELRTPLNAILGFSNLLRERSASQEQRRDLDIINRSGEHLLTLINDVLDVAKIEAGRTELEIAPCDLKAW